jgi:hypothetical protein
LKRKEQAKKYVAQKEGRTWRDTEGRKAREDTHMWRDLVITG